jgi:hypothetical protein
MANTATGDLIRASHFNDIRDKIVPILSTGSGQSGYGQVMSSASVGVLDPIRASQWNALRYDMLRCRQHQTGTDESNNLVSITQGTTVVSSTIYTDWNTYADTIVTNKFAIGATEGAPENVVTPAVKTALWNGNLANTVTVDFGSADAARYFFNAGGQFRITTTFVPNPSAAAASLVKNTTWQAMLSGASGVGTVTFNYTTTTASGGTTSNIGWWNGLTTSDQQILNKDAPSGSYSPNKFKILARTNVAASQIIFTIQLFDYDVGLFNSDGTPRSNNGFRIDEQVDGTLTNTVQMFRPQGTNVAVAVPTATQTGF